MPSPLSGFFRSHNGIYLRFGDDDKVRCCSASTFSRILEINDNSVMGSREHLDLGLAF